MSVSEIKWSAYTREFTMAAGLSIEHTWKFWMWEAIQMSINRWMGKEVWYTHTMEYYSARCASVLSCFSHVWLCDLLNRSPPSSSVQGILQARILEWVAMPRVVMLHPGDLSDPGIEPAPLMSPALIGGFFTNRAIWEAHFSAIKKKQMWVSFSEVDEPRACYTECSFKSEREKQI